MLLYSLIYQILIFVSVNISYNYFLLQPYIIKSLAMITHKKYNKGLNPQPLPSCLKINLIPLDERQIYVYFSFDHLFNRLLNIYFPFLKQNETL